MSRTIEEMLAKIDAEILETQAEIDEIEAIKKEKIDAGEVMEDVYEEIEV